MDIHYYKYNPLYEVMPDAIIVISNEGIISDLNSLTVQMFGYSAQELIGQSVEILLPEHIRNNHVSHRDRYLKAPTRRAMGQGVFKYNAERKDGTDFEVDISLNPLDSQPGHVIAAIRDISEHRQLETNALMFSRALETMDSGVLITDARQTDNPIIYTNPAFTNITGYSPEETLGLNCRFLQGENRDQPALEELRAAVKEGRSCRVELRNYHKDGSMFWNELILSPVHDKQGELTHFIGIQNDITEHKIATEALHDEINFNQAILNTTGALIIVLDPDGRITSFNQACEKTTGYSEAEIRGRSYLDLLTTDERKSVKTVFKSLKAGDFPNQFTNDWVTKNKERRTITWANTVLLDSNGEILNIIGTGIDITEQKQAEHELELIASVFDNTSEAIVITDSQYQVLRVNEAFTKITGFTTTDVVGKTPAVWRSYTHDKSFYQRMDSSLQNEGHWRGEIVNRRKNGEVFPTWQNITSIRNTQGEIIQYISILSDISKQKDTEKHIQHLHYYTELTNLPNRDLFNQLCEVAVVRAKDEKRKLSLIAVNLDQFKHINDSFGHPAGDQLIKMVAKRLENALPEHDTLSHFWGDEFAILAEGIRDSQDAFNLSQELHEVLKEPFHVNNHEIRLTTSIGLTLFPDDGEDVTSLIRNMVTAVNHAKNQGRNNIQFYTRELTESALQRVTLGNELQRAIEQNELVLFYQPQYSLKTGKMIGAEALIRWQHPEHGMIPPFKFIPVAEENGLIIPMGEWVLKNACQQMRTWLDQDSSMERICVNVSGQQMQQEELVGCVENVLHETGLKPSQLELEITESFIMKQTETVIKTLDGLKQLGVFLSIDDFGTGYSSLSYLKRLPVHKLKIDRSFISDIPSNTNDEVIAKAVLALGQSLQLEVIAEGVETKEQQEFLRKLNCDAVQGYLYSQPVPAEKFATLDPIHSYLK